MLIGEKAANLIRSLREIHPGQRGHLIEIGDQTFVEDLEVRCRAGVDINAERAGVDIGEQRDIDRRAPPPLMKRMIAAGRLGRKSGRHLYEYPH